MKQPKSLVSRRALFAGAGTAGAVAAAATLLPGLAGHQPEASPQAKEPPPRGGGYHVTDHVKRYYQSTRV